MACDVSPVAMFSLHHLCSVPWLLINVSLLSPIENIASFELLENVFTELQILCLKCMT